MAAADVKGADMDGDVAMDYFNDPDAEVRVVRHGTVPDVRVIHGHTIVAEQPRQPVHRLKMTISSTVSLAHRSTDPNAVPYAMRNKDLAMNIYPYDTVGMTMDDMDSAVDVPNHGISSAATATVEGWTAEQLETILWYGQSRGGQAHDQVSGNPENARKGFAVDIAGSGVMLNNNPSATLRPFDKFMISSFPAVKTKDGKADGYQFMPVYREGKQVSGIKPMVVPVHPDPMERIRRLHGPQYRAYWMGYVTSGTKDPKNFDPLAAYGFLSKAAVKSSEKAHMPTALCDGVYTRIALGLLSPAMSPFLMDGTDTNPQGNALKKRAEDVLASCAAGTKSLTHCLSEMQDIMTASKALVVKLFIEGGTPWIPAAEKPSAVSYASHYQLLDTQTNDAAKIRCDREISKFAKKAIYGTALRNSGPGQALPFLRR